MEKLLTLLVEDSKLITQPMDVTNYSLLAVLALVGKEAFSKINFPGKKLPIEYIESTEDYMILFKEENIMSENQRVALFSYLYLYVQLTDIEEYKNNLDNLQQEFNISEGIINNLQIVITKERISYIKNHYINREKEFSDLFVSTEEFISDMITNVVATPIQEEKRKLIGLESKEYEHPTDRIALEKLQVNKMFEYLLKWYSEYNVERLMTIQYTGSFVLVTEKNLPYLNSAMEKVCQILEVSPVPPLYLEQGFISAKTIGSSHPIVCISSACVSLLSYDELLFILGHEVGHIKSKHVLYHTLGSMLPYVGDIVGSFTFGIGDLVSSGLELALYNWYRKSEYTADRAGLLACQNPDAAISIMSKLAGFPPKYYTEINTDDLINQAADFEKLDSSKYNKVMKILSAMYKSHPWTVVRANELNKWIQEGEYHKTLNRERLRLKGEPSSIENNSMTCFCSNCGYKLELDAKFCKNCGTPNKKV